MKKLDKNEVLKLFFKIGFFNNFTTEEKYKLSELDTYIMQYSRGQYLITEGDKENALYILLKGEVYVNKKILSNIKIAKLKPGAVFGEISFLAHTPRTTNIIASGDALALKLDPDLLIKLGPIIENKVKDQLFKILINRLDRLNNALMKSIRFLPESERP